MKANTTKLVVLSVLFTSNNILFSVTHLNGNVMFWTSSGSKKSKGTKKVTLTTLSVAVKAIATWINNAEYKSIYVKTKGFNKNKKNVLKHLKSTFANVSLISDETCFPHNGCKSAKARRV
uniref:Ribosomal protein S11 n=1 Tax=Gloiopeltis furcata TaxID=42017 RepID=A0A5A4SCK8_9FLOR|nr:ribosomal protein S11 [Gloiopeltis furcata]BBK20782.1 ribosomal protein S11 [Gloiopeltis furcata]